MSVLPSQKLTIGELWLSMAVGLIMFLVPGDIKNQIDSSGFAEGFVFLTVFAITVLFFIIIKRFEAIGAALLTNSVITVASFLLGIVNGIISGGSNYWPTITDYQLVTMFILWTVPFFLMVFTRVLLNKSKDTEELRSGFSRFLSLSLRALMLIYFFVIIFKQVMPHSPDTVNAREINYMPLSKINECLDDTEGSGMIYMIWHSLIVAPLTFSLLILNPKIKWWQMLIISLAFGVTIEVLQFSLNTGTVYVDDLFMYLIGGIIGFLLKCMIDVLRSVITKGDEKTLLDLSYSPVDTGYDQDEYDAADDDESEEEAVGGEGDIPEVIHELSDSNNNKE